ncbi:hypothetical protein [uncultured Nostoc sp.]|uniref:hypothetical protein n=1 Tax=uncultured Nostoc sp. TaxID=340711 RepID=UPI0035C9F566
MQCLRRAVTSCGRYLRDALASLLLCKSTRTRHRYANAISVAQKKTELAKADFWANYFK